MIQSAQLFGHYHYKKLYANYTYMSVKAAKSYTIYRKEKAGNGNDG